MDFCAQTAEWAWSIILGMIKTYRNFKKNSRNKQRNSNNTSLQGRSPSEIAFALLYVKVDTLCSLRKSPNEKIFEYHLQKFIFDYTDPFS